MAAMQAINYAPPSSAWGSGQSTSSSARTAPKASKCSPDDGWLNALSHGSAAADGSPRTGKSPSHLQPLGLLSLQSACSRAELQDIASLEKLLNQALIPLTAFAEAEGEKGSKTRTWFNLKERPVFAWAGLWRESPEWGAVYSGVMTDCNEAIRPVHDRMPVLLHEDEYDQWLGGSFDEVVSFQDRCFPDDLIEMTRTIDPWNKPRMSTSAPALL